MSNLDSYSPSALRERRQALRRQRRWGLLRNLWQLLITTGFAVGTGWIMTRPGWIVHDSSAIQVDGTVFISPKAVLEQLPIDYPQSLFNIPTDDLEVHLEALGPIAEATFSRQLFPPRLTLHLQEHRPVALLVGNSYGNPDSQLYNRAPERAVPQLAMEVTGFMDANGTWLPLASYDELEEGLEELPTLRVIGMKPTYRQDWATLYAQIQQSPVEVLEIDWRHLDNLILNTELGTTHHGPYDTALFPKQLRVIDEMKHLHHQIDRGGIAYIDVRSPEEPLVQEVTGP